MTRKLRLLYAIGPGDIVNAYDLWRHRNEHPFEMSVAFSDSCLDWASAAGATVHLVSWNDRRALIHDNGHTVENRPRPAGYWKGGVRHHLATAAYGLSLLWTALRERPRVVIIDSGTTQWLIAGMVAALGIPVVAVMHSTLWPLGFPPTKRFRRMQLRADGLFFRRLAAATVCVSPECERQVRAIAKRRTADEVKSGRGRYFPGRGHYFQCRAQFRREAWSQIAPAPPPQSRPFRVLFVGRVEEAKGVFLILQIAEQLAQSAPGHFTWKIVGTGGASVELNRQIAQRKLGDLIDVTGRIPREQVFDAYGWAHAAIVPTTREYHEGMAMTAAEAVLAGRPVVMSTVVPAWEVLGDAALRAAPDDPASFAAALTKLADDPNCYEHCRHAALAAQGQFLDPAASLGAVLGRAITEILATRGNRRWRRTRRKAQNA